MHWVSISDVNIPWPQLVAWIIFVLAILYGIKTLWKFQLNKALDKRLNNLLFENDENGTSGSSGFSTRLAEGFYQTHTLSDKKYREFAEMLPEIVFECNISGMITFVNKAAFHTLGVNPVDLEQGINIFDFLHPDDKHQVRNSLKNMHEGKYTGGSEYRIFSHSGKMITVLAFTLPVWQSEEISGFRGILVDITDRKKQDAMLHMTRFGIEHAGDIIMWLNDNGQITYANQAACNAYGYTREQLQTRKLTDLDARIGATQWFEITQILESKSTMSMESIHLNCKDERFPVEISVNKLEYDDKKHYFTFVRNISERKRNDELEQKIQVARKSADLKQQFLANMSHEIRTPMTGIMGMTSMLMRSSLNMAQQEYVRNIKISSENLLNIINDILDLSKIEAGKMELKPVQVNLAKFAEQISETYQPQARHKGITFSYQINPLIPKMVIVDENRLKQLVNNLLSNSFKFTKSGEISVTFDIIEKTGNSLQLSCQVKDTGLGISKENQEQIFEKYTQIETSFVRPFEGTGLGLAICKELSNLMGGDIKVKSEQDKGSIFTFTFKAHYDDKDDEKKEEEISRELLNFNLRILHVEDKLVNQKVVGFMLFNAGCDVDFARNGQEAVELYAPGKYDIILMDIQMPVMDGISACKELRRLHGNQLCPVVGLSANALEGDAERFIELGLDDYITKPFRPQQLYEKLLKWTNKQNQSSGSALYG